MENPPMVPDIDSSRPHMAIRIAARENRAFLGRAVGYLAAEAGTR